MFLDVKKTYASTRAKEAKLRKIMNFGEKFLKNRNCPIQLGVKTNPTLN